jgi:hypothetical protein
MRQSKKNMVVSFAWVLLLRVRSARPKTAQLTAKFPIGRRRHHATRSVVEVPVERSVLLRLQPTMVEMVAPQTLSGICHVTHSLAQSIV